MSNLFSERAAEVVRKYREEFGLVGKHILLKVGVSK